MMIGRRFRRIPPHLSSNLSPYVCRARTRAHSLSSLLPPFIALVKSAVLSNYLTDRHRAIPSTTLPPPYRRTWNASQDEEEYTIYTIFLCESTIV